MIIAALAVAALAAAFGAGMVYETSRVGDLIVMRDQQGNCLAADPVTGAKTIFLPSADRYGRAVCRLSHYREIW